MCAFCVVFSSSYLYPSIIAGVIPLNRINEWYVLDKLSGRLCPAAFSERENGFTLSFILQTLPSPSPPAHFWFTAEIRILRSPRPHLASLSNHPRSNSSSLLPWRIVSCVPVYSWLLCLCCGCHPCSVVAGCLVCSYFCSFSPPFL